MTTDKSIPRWLKTTAWIVAVLVVLFHVGGAYVFSNMIKSDALTPQPPTADNGVYVRSLDGEAITLTSLEARADSLHPGVFGLSWEGGYGRLGGIVTTDGLNVIREFELVAGTTPPVCLDDLTACREVDIEGWAYQTDPSDAGLAFDEVTFQSSLGALSAWQVDSGDGSVWAIHAHGWRASRREAIRSLPAFDQAGITSLVIDYRNDPAAPPDPSGLYRFGQTEWQDVEAAVGYAVDHGATEVILVGYSTGGAIHAAFLEESEASRIVTAVVLDSPNLDMGGTVESAASEMTLPGTPLPVPWSLTRAAMTMADLRFSVDWTAIDYASRTEGILRVPTLIFHGTADERVPIEASREVAEFSEHVRLVEVPDAGHVTSWNVDPNTYRKVLVGFLAEATER